MANELVIVKSNSLIEASYKLTINEVRILALTVGVMDPNSNQQVFDFSVADFVREFPEIQLKNAYKEIQIAIKKLYDRSVRTETRNQVTDFRWVSSKTYYKNEGRFRIALTNEVMPYLTQLKGQFTQYQLRHISAFTSVYSIRIYELCLQYKNQGNREISLQDLKKWLQIENKYSAYFDFKKRVLAPAVKEINEKSDLLIDFGAIKSGRAVVAIKFIYCRKPTQQAPENPEKITPVKVRGRLPKRPPVKVGTHAEGEFLRACERQIRTGWKEFYSEIESWREILDKLPDSELEILYRCYKATGDPAYNRVNKILNARKKA